MRRLPQVQGVSDDELGATVKDIAEAATTAQPSISGDELSARIAEGVLSKYEGPVSEGYAMARDDAGRRTVDASPEDGFPTPLGFKMAAEDANRTLVDGVAEVEYQNELNSKVEEYRIAMAESARPDGDPNAQMKFTQDLMANPNYDQSFKNAVLEAGDVGFSEEPAEAPVTGGESTEDAPRPKEKPPIPQGPFDIEGEIDPDAGLLAETDEKGEIEEPPVRQGPFEAEVEQAANILDTDKKAGPKDIAAFKKEFMEAMPKYEGMSEEEKGFLIAEAGLRVMAGKDPNAITNIAEGLKGLGPALMKGAKEERAWKRQVELSAVKYGIERFNKAEAEERKLETTTEKLIGIGNGSFKLPNGKTVKFKEGEVVFVPKSIILETGTPGNLIDLQTRGIQITAAATKAKAAQAAQAAIREELIVKDSTSKALKESFLKSSDKVVLGYEVKALIENSFDISDDAAGLKNYGKELIFKGLSATGWRPESLLGKGSPEEKEAALVKQYGGRTKYNNQMQEVANRLLKRLLGEGSKNVSNVDRLLAQEISGLVKDISTGVSTNPTLLRQRLKRILEMSEKDIEAGQTEMQQMYSEYSTRIQPGMPIGVKGASYSDRVLAPLARQSLLERRRAIRTPQQQKVFGSISGFTFKDGKYVVNQK